MPISIKPIPPPPPQGICTWSWRHLLAGELLWDAEVIVIGELVALQHLGPGEAVRLHDRGAAVAHGLAE